MHAPRRNVPNTKLLAVVLLAFGWILEPAAGLARAMHPEWYPSRLPAEIHALAFWWVLLVCPIIAGGLAGWHWRARGLLAGVAYPAAGFGGIQIIMLIVTRLPVHFPSCPPGMVCEGPWSFAWFALIPSPAVTLLAAGIGWWLRNRASRRATWPTPEGTNDR